MTQQKHFQTWGAYRDFEQSILNNSRYIHNDTIQYFFDTILGTAGSRTIEEKSDRVLYRAQNGFHSERSLSGDSHPHPKKRMKPLSDKAHEGRINSKGIPCLYLAYSAETAMSEIRPNVGNHVSLAEFILTKPQRIIDCTIDNGLLPEMKRLQAAFSSQTWEPPTNLTEIENLVWSEINRAFSKPISNKDNTAEYAPTQILAELFKTNDYDGIKFGSSVSKGENLALFNVDDAKLENCQVQYVQSLSYNFNSAFGFEQYGTFHDIATCNLKGTDAWFKQAKRNSSKEEGCQ